MWMLSSEKHEERFRLSVSSQPKGRLDRAADKMERTDSVDAWAG